MGRCVLLQVLLISSIFLVKLNVAQVETNVVKTNSLLLDGTLYMNGAPVNWPQQVEDDTKNMFQQLLCQKLQTGLTAIKDSWQDCKIEDITKAQTNPNNLIAKTKITLKGETEVNTATLKDQLTAIALSNTGVYYGNDATITTAPETTTTTATTSSPTATTNSLLVEGTLVTGTDLITWNPSFASNPEFEELSKTLCQYLQVGLQTLAKVWNSCQLTNVNPAAENPTHTFARVSILLNDVVEINKAQLEAELKEIPTKYKDFLTVGNGAKITYLAPVNTPETTTPTDTTPELTTPSSEITTDTATPSSEITTDTETPSSEITTDTATPSSEITTDTPTPSSEITTDTATPSTEGSTIIVPTKYLLLEGNLVVGPTPLPWNPMFQTGNSFVLLQQSVCNSLKEGVTQLANAWEMCQINDVNEATANPGQTFARALLTLNGEHALSTSEIQQQVRTIPARFPEYTTFGEAVQVTAGVFTNPSTASTSSTTTLPTTSSTDFGSKLTISLGTLFAAALMTLLCN